MKLMQRMRSGAPCPSRSCCRGRRIPRPFSGAANPQRLPAIVTRAAAPDAEDAVETLEPLVALALEEAEDVFIDDDARAAGRVAQEVMESYALEAQIEALLEGAEPQAAAKAASLLEEGLEEASARLPETLSAAAVLAASKLQALEAGELVDVTGAGGLRKYDEEVVLDLTPEAAATVQRLKLTRNELANLVPSDWASTNVDWFTNKKENIPLPEYKLTFLWQRENISVAVDQVYSRGQTSPLTEYFIWPRKDAWDDLKTALEARPFVSERDKVILLNRLTDVINFWQQDAEKPPIEDARAKFPDCAFA